MNNIKNSIYLYCFFVKERRKAMMELLFFVLGLMIGGLTGLSIMCMLQINRINRLENINSGKEE